MTETLNPYTAIVDDFNRVSLSSEAPPAIFLPPTHWSYLRSSTHAGLDLAEYVELPIQLDGRSLLPVPVSSALVDPLGENRSLVTHDVSAGNAIGIRAQTRSNQACFALGHFDTLAEQRDIALFWSLVRRGYRIECIVLMQAEQSEESAANIIGEFFATSSIPHRSFNFGDANGGLLIDENGGAFLTAPRDKADQPYAVREVFSWQ